MLDIENLIFVTKENTSFGMPRILFVCPVFKMAAETVYWPIKK